jgi:hypothetical protein
LYQEEWDLYIYIINNSKGLRTRRVVSYLVHKMGRKGEVEERKNLRRRKGEAEAIHTILCFVSLVPPYTF